MVFAEQHNLTHGRAAWMLTVRVHRIRITRAVLGCPLGLSIGQLNVVVLGVTLGVLLRRLAFQPRLRLTLRTRAVGAGAPGCGRPVRGGVLVLVLPPHGGLDVDVLGLQAGAADVGRGGALGPQVVDANLLGPAGVGGLLLVLELLILTVLFGLPRLVSTTALHVARLPLLPGELTDRDNSRALLLAEEFPLGNTPGPAYRGDAIEAYRD
ncbi:unnamed protein product, partial [Clonostachys rosea]